MTPDEMLAQLHEHGGDAGSDLHDGLEGWFGWSIDNGILTTYFTPSTEDGSGTEDVAQWRLVDLADLNPVG